MKLGPPTCRPKSFHSQSVYGGRLVPNRAVARGAVSPLFAPDFFAPDSCAAASRRCQQYSVPSLVNLSVASVGMPSCAKLGTKSRNLIPSSLTTSAVYALPVSGRLLEYDTP